MRKVIFLLLLLLVTISLQAQEDDQPPTNYPTLTALESTYVPPLDFSRVAQELRGVTVIAPPPQSPPQFAVGDADTFFASNSDAEETFTVDADLLAIGDHVYIWVEQGAGVGQDAAQAVADTFDTEIYDQTRALWGEEPSPGVDGDTRLHILFAYNLGFNVGAYFAQRHTLPLEVMALSNEREMFFVNMSAFGTNIASPILSSTLAHEFQHMIRYNMDGNEDTWLNEGLSTFTELYLGYPDPLRYPGFFLSSPTVQLNTFGLSNSVSRGANYGAGFMFVTYFYERYGDEGIRLLSDQQDNGLIAVDNALQALDGTTADTFFADWAVANLIQDATFADGRYGYPFLGDDNLIAVPLLNHGLNPAVWESRRNQYSTAYYQLDDLQDDQKLIIDLDMPTTTTLIPTQAASGERMWYGNRGDTSETTLTRAFDLRDVETATLTFKTWYSIEEFWDYAYVTVSADGGATWDIITGDAGTLANPFGNSYGMAYTGYTDDWITQSIALDAYAGQDILLRFMYITDDAVNEPGFAIDDVAIPEIGYSSDFEADDGGWQSEGWLWMDNVLPQQAWVQVVEYAGDEVLNVTRLSTPLDNWSHPLLDATTRAVIAVSPYAPVTTDPINYTLIVESISQ